MPVQAFIVLDATERAAAMLLNYADAGVNPRKIDNPLSNLLGFGTLLNMYVVPARLLNDEPYERWYEITLFTSSIQTCCSCPRRRKKNNP